MERTNYERQASVPNGQSKPVTFDVAPDEARFSTGHVPATARSLGRTGKAHLAGAAMLRQACRPVYSVGPWLVVHTVEGEDKRALVEHYPGFTMVGDAVVIPVQEWDRRCRLGLAYPVRVVTAAPVVLDAHQAAGGRLPVTA